MSSSNRFCCISLLMSVALPIKTAKLHLNAPQQCEQELFEVDRKEYLLIFYGKLCRL